MKRFLVQLGGSLCLLTSLVLQGQGALKLVPAAAVGRSLPGSSVSAIKISPGTTQVKTSIVSPAVVGVPSSQNVSVLPDEDDLRLQKFLKLNFDRRASLILKELTRRSGEASETDATTSELTEQQDSVAIGNKEAENAPTIAQQTTTLNNQLDAELKQFQMNVTLGHWEAVRGFYASIKTKHVGQAYEYLIQSLLRPPGLRPNQVLPPNQARKENHVIELEDMLGIADAYPMPLSESHARSLGGFLRKMLSEGYDLQPVLRSFRKGTRRLGGQDKAQRLIVARILGAAGKSEEALEFLISPEDAVEANDAESLNLIALGYVDRHAKEPEDDWLVKAWEVTQLALDLEDAKESEREQALQRALDLSEKIDPALGEAWLEKVFASHPEYGLEIIAATGASSAEQRTNRSADQRLKHLQLQHRAVQSFLDSKNSRDLPWGRTLNLLALNWLSEAEHSYLNDASQSRFPSMQWDMYGNMYYGNRSKSQPRNPNQAQPIATGDILKVQPDENWLQFLNDGIRPKFLEVLAKLHLKVKEEEMAFPYIEKLAKTHTEEAHDLANEFIRIWTENHDPNTERNRRSTYMYIYGYNRNAEGIPLTRSKQVRNLEELTHWVKKLRTLPIEPVDEALLAKAFTTCHSVAEVYRLEDIEKVFGDSDSLQPNTLAGMIQTMRSNLATVWRKPDVQKNNKTQRKDKEIQAEVFRGYRVAGSVLEKGLEKYPDSWSLHLALACILFDENTYQYELTKDSQFTARRSRAFGQFEDAATLYAEQVEGLPQDKESSEVYEFWFYASLGATDLGGLRDYHQPDRNQPGKIRTAIMKLPGLMAERHVARFANALSTRITSLKAELKHRYLRAGLSIVGDHEKAAEARKLFDYYNDLVTEIQLVTHIDGSSNVGHQEPFGLFVDIRHTKEVERESGGFSKYLQNQNNAGYFYNYGRPTVNYRDDFEEAAREALKEHFEVLSVTFHNDKTESIGDAELGWRRTPYAYLLMKSLGPEVDMLPSLQMDFDFMDTSGYVVLPVESSKIAIDASKADARPFRDLILTQTVDERLADEGALVLEIKAVAHGLIPPLNQLVQFKQTGFEMLSTDDQGMVVTTLDQETDDLAPVGERQWMIRLQARPELTERPKSFAFPAPNESVKEVVYQRYQDADLASVGPDVILMAAYGNPSPGWPWMLLILILVLGVGYGIYRLDLKGEPEITSAEILLPDPLTPFTALGVLKKIQSDANISEDEKLELSILMNSLEDQFFSPDTKSNQDLKEVLMPWLNRDFQKSNSVSLQ